MGERFYVGEKLLQRLGGRVGVVQLLQRGCCLGRDAQNELVFQFTVLPQGVDDFFLLAGEYDEAHHYEATHHQYNAKYAGYSAQGIDGGLVPL